VFAGCAARSAGSWSSWPARWMRQATNSGPNRPTDRTSRMLDDSDRQVLHLLTQGSTNLEIAAELGVSEDGVAQRLARLIAQLGVSTRAEATSLAFRGMT
jgi:DNA-binding NarL/FixJ family response regulator